MWSISSLVEPSDRTCFKFNFSVQGGPYCFCILCAANTAKVLDAPKKLWYIYVHYIEAFYPRHNFLEISKFLLSKKLNLKLGSILAQNSTFNFEGV